MTLKLKSAFVWLVGLAILLPGLALAGPCKNVLIYYTSWSKYNAPAYNFSSIPYNQITHIAYSFVEPNADGSLSVPTDYMGADGVHYDGVSMVAAAHAAGVKVLLSCGGSGAGSTNYPTIAASTSLTNTFAANLLAYCQANNFDGVDIDWEFPNTTTWAAQFDNMLAGIRTQMPSPQWLLSAALSADSYSPYFLNISTLNNYLSFFNLMCYDYHGSWLTHSGDTAPLFEDSQDPAFSHEASAVTAVNYYISQGAAPAKINFGLPFYGYGYPTAGLYQNCGGNCNTTTLTYANIAPLVGNGWTRNWDSSSDSPNITYNSGVSVISYDDTQSITTKATYVLNTLGVGGIFAWSADQDYNGTTQPLLSAMYAVASSGCAPTSTPTITPTPTKTGTPTFTPTTVVASTWRVNCGGANYTDCQSNLWVADVNYSGGTGAAATGAVASALPCSTDQTLYQDQRYGANFTYTFNVPAGSYQVTLKFAETYSGDFVVGDRVFDVYINGTETLTNFDIYAKVGGNTACDQVFNNIAPTGGLITIQFKGTTSTDPNAVVEGIQIVSEPSTATATFTATASKTATPTASFTSSYTLSPTAILTNANTPTASYSPTVTSTLTNTDTMTATATRTSSSTPTNSPTGVWTPVDTATPTNTNSATASYTPSSTATSTSFFTSTLTFTNTITHTATGTPTATRTLVPATATGTATETSSSTSTSTLTLTPTVTVPPTSSPTGTATATLTHTSTVTLSWTPTSTYTLTNTPTPTLSPTLTMTRTFTVSPTLTQTSSPTHTPTPVLQPPVVYPNPVSGSTVNIKMPVMNAVNVKVLIFTIAMREVETVNVPQVAGDSFPVQLIDKSGMSLANGLYYFVIQADSQKWMVKVLVLR